MRKNYNGTLINEPEDKLAFLEDMCHKIQHLIYNSDKFADFSDEEVYAIDVATSRYECDLYQRRHAKENN